MEGADFATGNVNLNDWNTILLKTYASGYGARKHVTVGGEANFVVIDSGHNSATDVTVSGENNYIVIVSNSSKTDDACKMRKSVTRVRVTGFRNMISVLGSGHVEVEILEESNLVTFDSSCYLNDGSGKFVRNGDNNFSKEVTFYRSGVVVNFTSELLVRDRVDYGRRGCGIVALTHDGNTEYLSEGCGTNILVHGVDHHCHPWHERQTRPETFRAYAEELKWYRSFCTAKPVEKNFSRELHRITPLNRGTYIAQDRIHDCYVEFDVSFSKFPLWEDLDVGGALLYPHLNTVHAPRNTFHGSRHQLLPENLCAKMMEKKSPPNVPRVLHVLSNVLSNISNSIDHINKKILANEEHTGEVLQAMCDAINGRQGVIVCPSPSIARAAHCLGGAGFFV